MNELSLERVLVVGASSYVGQFLCKKLTDICQVWGTFFRSKPAFTGHRLYLDVRDMGMFKDVLQQIMPDAILYLACDFKDLEASIVTGINNLVKARELCCPDARIVFLSTDAVFDGESGPYGENDVPRPVWPYGVAKRKAEIAVVAAGGTVVRTSLVYGFDPMDSRTVDLLHGLKTGAFSYPYFSDEIRCPVFVEDLCHVLVEKGKGHWKDKHIIHVAGFEPLNRLDFAKRIARRLGYDGKDIPHARLTDSGLTRPRDLTLNTTLAKRQEH